jgi:hypothetical protein
MKKLTGQWPRRVFFAFMVFLAAFMYNRFFSVLLVALVFLLLEAIFTRIDNNTKAVRDLLRSYTKDK